jgi:hypothetical protein
MLGVLHDAKASVLWVLVQCPGSTQGHNCPEGVRCPPVHAGLLLALQPDVDAVIDILLDVDLSAAGTAAGDAAAAAGQPYPRLGWWPPHHLSMQCDTLHMFTRHIDCQWLDSFSSTLHAVQLHCCIVQCAPVRLADPAALGSGGAGSRGAVPPPVTLPPPSAHRRRCSDGAALRRPRPAGAAALGCRPAQPGPQGGLSN